MRNDSKCEYPYCRQYPDGGAYCNHAFCSEHFSVIMTEDGTGHRFVAKHNKEFKFEEGCYCAYCRSQQDLPTPSWELEDDSNDEGNSGERDHDHDSE